MDTLIIEGIPAYNGEYPLDMTYFTNRELHLIKKVAGVRAGELGEAFAAGDNDLMVAVAAIAIRRKTGTEPNVDALWDAESGKFTFKLEAEEPEQETSEDEDVPLPTGDDENETGVVALASRSETAGPPSTSTSERPAKDLRAIGAQG